ncbi:hypothetical protein [Caudoviricetes sp.]|nr:hypothetical protein [Caudoviricetes sp.]
MTAVMNAFEHALLQLAYSHTVLPEPAVLRLDVIADELKAFCKQQLIATLQQPDPEANCVHSVDNTLAERGTNYGEFNDFAEICQGLTLVAREQPGWDKLSNPHREALEMIIHKISRVLNGNPNYKDSWHDIQGYAKLAEDACEE